MVAPDKHLFLIVIQTTESEQWVMISEWIGSGQDSFFRMLVDSGSDGERGRSKETNAILDL